MSRADPVQLLPRRPLGVGEHGHHPVVGRVPQAKGERLATYGLTEPGAGSDVVGARSTARREGDEWVLNGEKMWISLADVADNFLFFCWTDEEKRRKRDHSGMSCFIVERGMKGFSSGTIHGKMGIRAGNTGYFSLQDVRVPAANMGRVPPHRRAVRTTR